MSNKKKSNKDIVSCSDDIGIFYEQQKVKMPDGTQAKVGDIVICAVGGDWSSPCDIGIVKKVAAGTKLRSPL